MLTRFARNRLSSGLAYSKPTPFQRNPYSGFTDPAHFFPGTGFIVSGGKMNATAVAQFELFEYAYGFRAPITPSIPYDVQILADSVTSGPKLCRFIIGYWRGQQSADGQSAIRADDTLASFSFNTGLSPTFTVIPPADCTHVNLVLQYMDTGGLTAVFDDFTFTG